MKDKLFLEKMLYHPVCNTDEIERIFNITNARDYLLKIRADIIVDNMRLYRVYRNKALMYQGHWSLEKSFNYSHYECFLKYLNDDLGKKCKKITYGNIFSTEPNGTIFKTEHGPIITICDSLQFFFKFSHLALMGFETEIPTHVQMNALRIAMRVMLKKETLDFLMDPRGIVPKKIAQQIHAPIPFQLQFIAGHEFAHYILGHISETDTFNKPTSLAVCSDEEDYKPLKVFNTLQSDEFEADIQSILLPSYSAIQRKNILEAALLWFGSLELYETVIECISPRSSSITPTHPTALERFENLLTNIPTPKGFQHKQWHEFILRIDNLKKVVSKDVTLNFEVYEMYGSAYLDKPNTAWRGRELEDRVDYY